MRLQISEWSGLRPRPATLGTASDRPDALEWDESLRYFRLSQATDDLFDAFRNLFLALESILSLKTPQQSEGSESKWLRRAWGAARERMSSPQVPSDPATLCRIAPSRGSSTFGMLCRTPSAIGSHTFRSTPPRAPSSARLSPSRRRLSRSARSRRRVAGALGWLHRRRHHASPRRSGLARCRCRAPRRSRDRTLATRTAPNGAARQREWAGGVEVPQGLARPVTITIEASLGRPMSAPSLASSLDLSGIERFEAVVVVGIAPSRVRTLYSA